MSLSALTLYTQPGAPQPDHTRLIETLRSIGLVGLSCGPHQYLSGPRLFDHLTFLGCSPNLALTPDEGEDFLRIFVPQHVNPVLRTAKTARAPLCPACKQGLTDWQEHLSQTNTGTLECDHCEAPIRINELNLRKRACYASTMIHIAPVFESEAVPVSTLLDTLETQFSIPFYYAYTQMPLSG